MTPGVVAPTAEPRRVRVARIVSVAAWLAACGFAFLGLIFWGLSGWAPLALRFLTPIGFAALIFATVAQATAGLILRLRRPDLVFGGFILGFALTIGLAALAIGLVPYAVARGEPELAAWIAWLSSGLSFTGGTLTAELLGLLFPTGRLISPRWAWAALIVVFASLFSLLGLLFTPGQLWLFPDFRNPIAPGDPTAAARLLRDVIGPVIVGLASIVVGAAFVVRYRLAADVERLQIRWYLISGAALALAATAYVGVIAATTGETVVGQVVLVVFYVLSATPPLAMVFGILRYRLLEIDRIVNRAVVLGVLTALLAGLYAASIRLFNAAFVALTGESSEAALVLTTLVLAATFTPLKGRLERIADHWSRGGRPVASTDGPVIAEAAADGGPGPGPAPIDRAEIERLVEATVRRVLAEDGGASHRTRNR